MGGFPLTSCYAHSECSSILFCALQPSGEGSTSFTVTTFLPNVEYYCLAEVYSFKAVSPSTAFANFTLKREFTQPVMLLECISESVVSKDRNIALFPLACVFCYFCIL